MCNAVLCLMVKFTTFVRYDWIESSLCIWWFSLKFSNLQFTRKRKIFNLQCPRLDWLNWCSNITDGPALHDGTLVHCHIQPKHFHQELMGYYTNLIAHKPCQYEHLKSIRRSGLSQSNNHNKSFGNNIWKICCHL